MCNYNWSKEQNRLYLMLKGEGKLIRPRPRKRGSSQLTNRRYWCDKWRELVTCTSGAISCSCSCLLRQETVAVLFASLGILFQPVFDLLVQGGFVLYCESRWLKHERFKTGTVTCPSNSPNLKINQIFF